MKKIVLGILTLLSLTVMASANMKACMGCHGQEFEKKALGKSKVVKDMSEEEIATALQGYKDGTYGGAMKGVMAGQVKNIPDVKIAAKHVHMISQGQKPGMEHGTPSPEMFKKKKAVCGTKLKEINDCFDSADKPQTMIECKKLIIKLADHIKEITPASKLK